MNRRLLLITLALILALLWLIGQWQQPFGLVFITNGKWTFENSLNRSLIIALPLFFISYFLIRLSLKLWRAPREWRRHNRRRHTEKARRFLVKGLIALSEGDWATSERLLLRNVQSSETPLLNYLLAARAAQQQNADSRRDMYLQKASTITPEANLAIGLTQAELQLQHGQYEQALATLNHLREHTPKHQHVLKLISRAYSNFGEWRKLADILPALRSQKILPDEKLLLLERQTYAELLRSVAKSPATLSLEQHWEALPKQYREDVEILRVYVQCLLASPDPQLAERPVREFLNKEWDEDLVRLYALIPDADTNKQLETTEQWLKDQGRSPMLYLSLARFSARLQQWGRARVYYERSIELKASIDAYAELGDLLETLGEADSAFECYRKGLQLFTADSKRRNYNRRTLADFRNSTL
ncbi:MAG: tetratricopeptide repeat protein [Gammaproteobacteria bacterium]|nr:tetratricopeptide repeat protein [Gammaproteobacteria bacterium]